MSKISSTWKKMSFLIVAVLFAAPLPAEGLPDDMVQAWNQYVHLTEKRIERELNSPIGFLSHDFQELAQARADRERILAGKLVVSKAKTTNIDGSEIKISGGMIHHWRGAVLIPGVSLDEVMNTVSHPDAKQHQQEDVLESKVLERTSDSALVYMKLVRSKIVSVTYNTEHLVHYYRHGPRRASSRTTATKVAELADAGTLSEHEKAQGKDHGFLWRLNSYWRYEQVDEGVLVECESLTLSRSIPGIIAPIVRPIVNSVAKESMRRTLSSIRGRFSNFS